MRLIPVLLCCTLSARAAHADNSARRVELVPQSGSVGLRAYGLGMLPLDGLFTRFHGWFSYDADDRSRCRVELTVDVASLLMEDAATRETVTGPDFLDAAQFPTLTYAGSCQAPSISGMLDMHGVKHPFSLSLTWGAEQVKAEGHLRRADWGMTAMPFLAGQTVRIVVSAQLGSAVRTQRN